ncbi:MAG: alpha/beta hydrolase [Rickettsiales bacterium]|nr:alpha/beta hydrolase [Rickettsiales bacterium]MCA0254630.1 alpha/beta fold hydrolase [Pseudomonadota bacterium]
MIPWFQLDKYESYKFDYQRYSELNIVPSYISNSSDSVYKSDVAELLTYTNIGKYNDVYLVVPSIFNSPEIVFLSEEDNFIRNLSIKGKVYLVNWIESDKQIIIDDLIQELETVTQVINKLEPNRKLHLIGHCIGGNLCIALAQNSHFHSSLTLLTVPWDFSHFSSIKSVLSNTGVSNLIDEIDYIPKIYIQILFFLMFPSQYISKVEKYDTLSLDSKKLFMKVESWLQSGMTLPKSLYIQIIDEICTKNVCFKKQWSVKNKPVYLSNIKIPTCIIYARDDQIVPYKSIVPLQNEIRESTLIEVEGGHISYLLNPKNFTERYNNWLVSLI